MNNSKFAFRPPFLRSSVIFTTMGCLLALAVSARAEELVRYKAKPLGSLVRIEGSANVHDWTMEGTLISGYLEVPVGVVLDSSLAEVAGATGGKVIAHAEVAIPVNSVKNGKYDAMDEVMLEAMGAKDYPRINFHLTEMTLKQPHTAGTPFQFDAKGKLSLHGVTNKISMPVTIESVDKMKLKVIGAAVPVNMTDYKIRPPVKLGLFITQPEVKISFTWIVGLANKPVAAK